jgi:hypothetical protein
MLATLEASEQTTKHPKRFGNACAYRERELESFSEPVEGPTALLCRRTLRGSLGRIRHRLRRDIRQRQQVKI